MTTRQFLNPRDMEFWLYELGFAGDAESQQLYADSSRSEFESMFAAATEVAEGCCEGLATILDENEPVLKDGEVWNHPQLSTALKGYLDSGFFAAPFAREWGGMELPYAVSQALNLPLGAHAGSGYGYLFLTAAAAHMLSVVGSDEQKALYLPKMVTGEWFGTMMLSEPQAGSSVGDIRTRATRQPDGSYHLKGTKMWISGGDQQISENIIHMVLAKVEDGNGQVKPGSGGISLFLVPKFLVTPDGSLGEKNGVTISGVNHKMGQRGTVNTIPVLGAEQPCVGYLLGAEDKGMAAMFHMMNEARIGIGMGAAQLAYYGFRYAAYYATERTQGRPVTNPDLSRPQVPIIEHADVKRMLLQQKALSEGAMMLCFHAADLIDRIRASSDEDERHTCQSLLAILTPVVKTWPSKWGLHSNYLSIQVLGGYGYTRDYPVERLYRDNRLNEIHEGTTGIQGLDLLARKVLKGNGDSLAVLFSAMQKDITEANQSMMLRAWCSELVAVIEDIETTTAVLFDAARSGQVEAALANSSLYLDMVGHCAVAWMWLRAALAADTALPAAHDFDRAFYEGKLRACRYFFAYELPRARAQAELLRSLDDVAVTARADEF